MANGKRTLTLLAIGALAAAGCGGDHAQTDTDADALVERAAERGAAVDLDPEVSGRELLRLQRVGEQMGTSDVLKFGADGSVIVIKSYGGGGELIQRCTQKPGELGGLRRDLRALPLEAPEAAPEPERPSFYAKPPTQYTLTAGRYVETFTAVEMPRDARPLVRRLRRTLSGHAARCRVTYRTRS